MKRYGISLTLILLLLSWIHVSGNAETGSASASDTSFSDTSPEMLSTSEFTEDSHPWALDYRSYFLTQTTNSGNLIFSVEECLFQSELATDLLAQVTKDLQVISAALPVIDKPYRLYVVKQTLNNTVQQIGDVVYCTVEDIVNGNYRAALIAVVSEISALWKSVGLSGVLFERPIDDALLRAHYEQAEALDILSLFPVYYHSEFASDEEMAIARETAFSLTEYIVREHGMDTFLAKDRMADRQEWLYFLGVNREYIDPYAETLAGYHFAFWQAGYPLVVTTDKGDTMYMRPMRRGLDNAANVRTFLCEAKEGIQAILSGIEKNAPDYYDTIHSNYQQPIKLYFGDTYNNMAYWGERRIELGFVAGYFHEMVHMLIPTKDKDFNRSDTEMWKFEAICDWLSIAFAELKREDCYNTMEIVSVFNASDYAQGSMDMFYIRVYDRYRQQYGELPDSWKDFDLSLYYKAFAHVQMEDILLSPTADDWWLASISDDYNRRFKKTDGNELTGHQAYYLADFLIERYGLSAFLRYCLDGVSFDATFGLSYKDAKAAWMKDELNLAEPLL